MNWIQQITGDQHYNVVEVSGNGDCFFTAVKEAFSFNGSKVNVEGLRKIVARNMTDDILHEYMVHWKEAQKTRDGRLLYEFSFMKNVSDLESLRSAVETSLFWGNETAISILERVLLIKFIIFSERRFRDKKWPCIEVPEIIDESIDPQWYVILTFNGGHYDLVTYSSMTRMKKEQLPAQLRSDIFYHFPQFRKKVVGWTKNTLFSSG
jgi:hypothetical protein